MVGGPLSSPPSSVSHLPLSPLPLDPVARHATYLSTAAASAGQKGSGVGAPLTTTLSSVFKEEWEAVSWPLEKPRLTLTYVPSQSQVLFRCLLLWERALVGRKETLTHHLNC